MKMKKTIPVLLTILVCSGSIAIATTKVNPITVLQTKLTAYINADTKLTAQVAQLNSTIADYKSTAAVTEDTGKIYKDGVQVSAAAKFANIKGTQYVSADDIISDLTNKTDAEYKYVDSTKSLYIGAMPVAGEVNLTDLKYYAASHDYCLDNWGAWNQNNPFTVNGEKFYKGIGFIGDDGNWVQYKPNSEYKTLKFKVGIDDWTMGSGNTGGITITGDGKVIYTSSMLEAQDKMVEQTLDISNIKLLTITDVGGAYTVVADPTLIP